MVVSRKRKWRRAQQWTRIPPRAAPTRCWGSCTWRRSKPKRPALTSKPRSSAIHPTRLPRLGLGLAIIRDGKLADGREQLEIAVALDPTNSLLRSYVGKAYYEENTKERDQLAAAQFGLAKELDPNDPTPWFYDAILAQSQNRSVDALLSLHESVELTENRAVYRSQLLLDQDRASRSSSLAQIYDDAGFYQLAIAEALRSLNEDPDSYASHRFLAETYENSPRREFSRESEHLQALLRAPIGIVPVSPFRGVETPSTNTLPRAAIARSVTPQRASYNSYEPLFERPGLSLFADALAASLDTVSAQAIVAGMGKNVAFSAGYGEFRTDGFDTDRDLTQYGGNFFAQVRASDRLYLQSEFVDTKVERGVVSSDFDPASRSVFRTEDHATTARVGARYELEPNSLFFINAATQSFDTKVTDIFGVGQTTGDASAEEAQYSYSSKNFGLVSGGGYLDATIETVGVTFLPTDSSSAFAYTYGRLSDQRGLVDLHLGLNWITVKTLGERLTTTNPKLGAFISPLPGTTVRIAVLQTTRRQTISNETLEPTQVAGFNQFWDDPIGSTTLQRGAGVDQRLGQRTYVGAEYIDRETEAPLFLLPGVSFFTITDKLARAYLYHVIPTVRRTGPFRGWSLALSAEYSYDEIEQPEDSTLDGVVNLYTRTVPLAVTVFPNNGLSFRFGATYIHRTGLLQVFPGFGRFDAENSGWFGDVELAYRLPNRHGRISVGIRNVFDEPIRIIDSNSAALAVPPEQVVFARISLTF